MFPVSRWVNGCGRTAEPKVLWVVSEGALRGEGCRCFVVGDSVLAGVETPRTKCLNEIVSLWSSALSSLRDSGLLAHYFGLKPGVRVKVGKGPSDAWSWRSRWAPSEAGLSQTLSKPRFCRK